VLLRTISIAAIGVCLSELSLRRPRQWGARRLANGGFPAK
jgi:hypothetical protein